MSNKSGKIEKAVTVLENSAKFASTASFDKEAFSNQVRENADRLEKEKQQSGKSDIPARKPQD